MNTNIETALMSLIGSDPRFQRAMAMMQGRHQLKDSKLL